jgi:hypothetical protein
MASRAVLVSDLSGVEVSEKDHARVVVQFGSKRVELDTSVAEVENLIKAGRETKKRGRPAKTAA